MRCSRPRLNMRSTENSLLLTEPAVEIPGAVAEADRPDLETVEGIDWAKGHRLVPVLAWLAVVLTLVFIPFKILSHGYMPPDDALRHVGKAISGRDWSEILVLQDKFSMDHNPGWHWILTQIHQVTGVGADGLLVVSFCGLMLLFTLSPLGWVRRPEAWVGALLVGMVFFPTMLVRYYYGRPFLFSVAVTLAILCLWRKDNKASPALLAVSTVLFALAAWIHGSWYLFGLVVAAFGLAGQWRSCFSLAGCWLAGSFTGALLTGHPIAFLGNAINIAIACFGQVPHQLMLVTEFQASDGSPTVVLIALALLIIRAVSGNWKWNAVRNPVFILFVLGWILGFRVSRFWDDWGLPAFTLWMAFELQGHLNRHASAESFRRLVITLGLCGAFFFCVTGDLRARWSRALFNEHLSESDPEMDPWLPEDGGILYSSNMHVFYQTFFKNPHAKWKYILGFESAFMPPEDLRIYRNIQWNFYSAKSHEPWVARMRAEDRLVIPATSSGAPSVQGLEWKYVARDTWIGRLPRENTPGSAKVSDGN